MNEGLERATTGFVDGVTPLLEVLAGEIDTIRADELAGDVALEAFDLAAAMVDADGLHTDNELDALIATFGPLLEPRIGHLTGAGLRRSGILDGRRAWVEAPSPLLSVICAADRRHGTSAAWRYYDGAMAIAHEIAGSDVHVSHLELEALERLRGTLLRTIGEHGIDRPAAAEWLPGGAPTSAAPAHDGPKGDDGDGTSGPVRSIEELFAELDALVGLDAVKHEVKLVADLLRVQAMRRGRGLPVAAGSRHLVFTGNPGTGKTTVARLLAEIYRSLGVVRRGHLVETDRSGLVAGFVGQTAERVAGVVRRAVGGVLLIDEAYSLARGNEGDFGREAIDTLVKLMEDHRDELVVIVTGYTDEMATLIDANPGLRSRFPTTIHFPDYTTDELVAIVVAMGERDHYRLDDDARDAVRRRLDALPRDRGFGNARAARNLFEAAVGAHASRVVRLDEPSDADLTTLTGDDFDAGRKPGTAPARPSA